MSRLATLADWSVNAVNLIEHADNAIHTDAGARAAGFSGALVAGVTTYAYLTHLPTTAWGLDWLTHGGATVRFLHPVLAGDPVDCVTVHGELPTRDAGSDTTRKPGHATVTAQVAGDVKVDAEFVDEVADEITHREGESLTPIEFVLDESWSNYGARAGDDCSIYAARGLAHAASWPRIANRFCHEQLVTGPWIHVRSRIAHLGVAAIDAEICATAVVVERIDSRAGQRAILDVAIEADGVPVAAVEHEAIIELAS